MTTTVDRHKAAELHDAMIKAQDALEEAKYDERFVALNAKYEALFAALDEEHEAKQRALTKQKFAELGLDDLEAKVEAAEKAYNDENVPMVDTDDDGNVRRCALSGDPILDGEEVFVHDDGRLILADKIPPSAQAQREAA